MRPEMILLPNLAFLTMLLLKRKKQKTKQNKTKKLREGNNSVAAILVNFNPVKSNHFI